MRTPFEQKIGFEILDRLHATPELENARIDVHVDQGCVTLRGSVEDHLSKSTALRLAQEVKGVVKVHDQLEVRPDWAEEHAPLGEFCNEETTAAMCSPQFRLVDSL